jgi:Ca2+-binding RTX toxin-like protein
MLVQAEFIHMAVTTTYNWLSIAELTSPRGPATTAGDVTTIGTGPSSGFLVTGDHNGHTDFDTFNSAAAISSGGNLFGGTNSAVDQLTDGNVVIVSQDADSIRVDITNTGGGPITSFDINDPESSNADVVALVGGGFVVTNQDSFSTTDNDIDFRLYSNTGSLIQFDAVDSSAADDRDATVAALNDGGFAIVWTRTTAGDQDLWCAVYNADGSVRTAAAAIDTAGTIVGQASAVGTANGGFAIAYRDNGWDGETDITVSRYNANGSFLGWKQYGSTTTEDLPSLTRMNNGQLALTYSRVVGAEFDTYVSLIDQNNGTELATTFISGGGQSLLDETLGSSAAAYSNGRLAVFETNFTDGTVVGEALVAQRTSTSDSAGDNVFGDDYQDIMFGNDGNDLLYGYGNADTIFGGNDDDILWGGTGLDEVRGEAGNDLIYVAKDDLGTNETVDGGTGGDVVNVFKGNVNLGKAIVLSIEEIEFGVSASFNQSIYMEGLQMGGGAFSSFLTLDGRVGATDYLQVTMGVDTDVNASNWTFVDWNSSGADADRVIILGDADADTIRGTSERDLIKSKFGADWLYGKGGSDNLNGGGPDGAVDRFVFDTALGSSNIDTIVGFEVNIDEVRLENTGIFTGLVAGSLSAAAFRIGASAADASDRIIYNSANGALYFDADGLGGTAQVRFANIGTGLALDNLDFVVF